MSIEDDSPPAISAVHLKLPPFWPADPEVWFAQVEAQFTTKGIRATAQKARFDHIVASLSPEYAIEVRDLILKPPADHAYDTLKAQLIKRTAASEQRKLQQLFTAEELGDRKPTQLLRRMQQLLGDKGGIADGNDSFLRELFLQRLPANVRMVLASADTSLSLAELADKVMEVVTTTVAATSLPPPSTEVAQLRQEVTRLAELVQSLTTHPPHPRSRNSSRNRRSPSPARPRQASDPSLCWYHQKFGDAALKCREPCTRGLNPEASH